MGLKRWVIAGLIGLSAQVVTLLGFSGVAMAAVDGSRPPPSALQGVVSLNVGGKAYVASDGRHFSGDDCAVEQSDSPCANMASIKGTQHVPLYQSYRLGEQAYDFEVPNGDYAVTLHFAEPFDQAVGSRVFDVLVQGQPIFQQLDVRANRDGHHQAALSRTVDHIAVSDGRLEVALKAVQGAPILSAIEAFQRVSVPDTAARLIWSDEFDDASKDGRQAPRSDRWAIDIWPARKVNDEDQAYTARHQNVRVESGVLILEAHQEAYQDAQYTSARVHTKGLLDLQYGQIEVRAKLPRGQGTWPAIWMLPSNPFKFATTCDASVPEWQGNADCDAWPNSGEIDIMEHVGFDPGVVHGTVHTKAYYWANWNQHKGSIVLPDFDQFHRYQLIWTADQITWLVDDIPYFSYVRESQDWAAWPFSEPFHLILNLAMGGNWGRAGGPIDNRALPARMEVDYVRVYASEPDGSKSLAPE